jgi:hypothetical protein
MFDLNAARDFTWHGNAGGNTVGWSFSLELNRTEEP